MTWIKPRKIRRHEKNAGQHITEQENGRNRTGAENTGPDVDGHDNGGLEIADTAPMEKKHVRVRLLTQQLDGERSFSATCDTSLASVRPSVRLQGAAKKVAPKVFCRFLGNCLEFCRIFFTNLYIDILLSKCQVIYYSVEKQRNYGLFKVTSYRFSSVKNVQATTL